MEPESCRFFRVRVLLKTSAAKYLHTVDDINP